jgi:16S rRNA (guanine(966)-N(2))-methyltransferase RsmD
MLLCPMRIISGEFRRRLLESPRDALTTRPIPDRVKESVFQLLRGHYEEATVFDGFSGTGAIGLEAVSRGASRCVLVERDRTVADILKRNIETLGCGDRCELVVGDVLGVGALARCPKPCHLIFLDPPYPLVREATGFRRVMDQLSKLIDRLDATGFAVLRTPWPLYVLEGISEATVEDQVEVVPEASFKKKGKRDRTWEQPLRSPAAKLHLPPEAPPDDSSLEPSAEEDKDSMPPRSVKADLTLPNAKGPETHAYGSMAVHLYMKK